MKRWLGLCAGLAMLSAAAIGQSWQVRVRAASGQYRLRAGPYQFTGSVGQRLQQVRRRTGRDRMGAYHATRFAWRWQGRRVEGEIRVYAGARAARFLLHFPHAVRLPALNKTSTGARAAGWPIFPDFTVLPRHFRVFSYRNWVFSPPQFRAGQSGTPWLLYNRRYQAWVVSPASHFQLTVMHGDGRHEMGVRLDGHLRQVPAGFTMSSVLVFAPRINPAFERWGRALNRLSGRRIPSNQADDSLRYLGYWTDNGAHYYYHYRPALGYTGTLLAELAHLRKRNIPVRYLQIDSWWYQKDSMYFNGRLLHPKNPKFPKARWNVYGGVWRYTASRTLFPHGLKAFQQAAGLPLITHGRWISQRSPYHKRYRIEGIAPVDMKYWNHIAGYLHANGVVTYEQDWLNFIRQYSHFASKPRAGHAFFHDMSASMQRRGITLQYCMPVPAEILQGSLYPNLTTTRVSDDHFVRARWYDFLFTSRLASALGIRPWADVCSSRHVNAILLQTLSAGPVGFGNAIGREKRSVLMQATRADGVLVKPDSSLVPVDRDYELQAHGIAAPLLGRAFTERGGLRTAYVFAFTPTPAADGPVQFRARTIGLHGPMYVLDYFQGTAAYVPAGKSYSSRLGHDAASYYICATPGPGGIAFLGDANEFVGLGKARVPAIQTGKNRLRATIRLAAGEESVIVRGFAPQAPTASASGGRVGKVRFNPSSHLFTLQVMRPEGGTGRKVSVRVTIKEGT